MFINFAKHQQELIQEFLIASKSVNAASSDTAAVLATSLSSSDTTAASSSDTAAVLASSLQVSQNLV